MKGAHYSSIQGGASAASWKEQVMVEGPGMRAHAQLRSTFAASTNPANVQRVHATIWPAQPRALIVRSRILLTETEACLSCSFPPLCRPALPLPQTPSKNKKRKKGRGGLRVVLDSWVPHQALRRQS